MLIQRVANVCTRNIEGKTPFHTFFREINRELLAFTHTTLETAISDDRGMHILHHFAWTCKSTIADIQPVLASDGSNVFVKDHEGRSVLFFTAERGNFTVLDYFLQLPERPNMSSTDVNGLSLMHYAVRSPRVQIVDRLYHHGCSIQVVEKKKQTLFHHAVKRGNLEAIKRFLLIDESNSLLENADSQVQTPLDLAESINDAAIIAYLEPLMPASSQSEDVSRGLPYSSNSLDVPELRHFSIHYFYQATSKWNFWKTLAMTAILAFGGRFWMVLTSSCSNPGRKDLLQDVPSWQFL